MSLPLPEPPESRRAAADQEALLFAASEGPRCLSREAALLHASGSAAPLDSPEEVLYLGRTVHRGSQQPFGIRAADLRSHVYAVGRTGAGKTTLLRIMALQQALRGRGVVVLDPHGDLAASLAAYLHYRSDRSFTYLCGHVPSWHFNPLECDAKATPEHRALVGAGLVEVFRKIWEDAWGPRLEHLLRSVLLALLETPGSTLGNVPRLLTDRVYRSRLVHRLRDPVVRAYWTDEFERYSPAFRSVVVSPLQNKVGALLSDPRLRRILTSPKSTLSLRETMDSGGSLLVNLSKGRMGEGPSSLLGALLVSQIALEGLARAAQTEDHRRDVTVYLDEFQSFSTRMLATMLSELRKYRVGLVLAHQYLAQLDPVILGAVLGNVGTTVAFRVGAVDAPRLAREFEPVFEARDLIALPNHRLYLRLMIDGSVSKPFSAETFGSLGDVPGFQ